MRYTIGGTLLVLGALAGGWHLGAGVQERAVQNWLSERRADGWVAEVAALDVTGFPTRFETAAEGLNIADPRYGWALELPTLNFSQAAYQPNDIALRFPDQARITTPSGGMALTAGRAEGHVHFRAGTALALKSSSILLQDLALQGDAGWTSAMTSATLTTAPAEGTIFGHQITIDASELRFAEGLRQMLDPAGRLPRSFESFTLNAVTDFDRQWDRLAIEGVKPKFTKIDLEKLRAEWGPMALEAKGAVVVDPNGIPTGTLSLRAKDWENMLVVAVETGALPRDMAGPLRSGLSLISALSGNAETLDIKLVFEEGRTLLGPVPIGPAPRLIIQ